MLHMDLWVALICASLVGGTGWSMVVLMVKKGGRAR